MLTKMQWRCASICDQKATSSRLSPCQSFWMYWHATLPKDSSPRRSRREFTKNDILLNSILLMIFWSCASRRGRADLVSNAFSLFPFHIELPKEKTEHYQRTLHRTWLCFFAHRLHLYHFWAILDTRFTKKLSLFYIILVSILFFIYSRVLPKNAHTH